MEDNKLELEREIKWLSLASGGIAVFLNLLYYAYKIGYFYTLKIDLSYIEIGNMSIYTVIIWFAISTIICMINWIIYSVLCNKKFVMLIFVLGIEFVICLLICLRMSNITVIEFFEEVYNVYRWSEWKDLILIFSKCSVLVLFVNIFGIVFSGIKVVTGSTIFCKDDINSIKKFLKAKNTLYMLIGLLAIVLIVGAIGCGSERAFDKRGYKVVTQLDNKYAVIYENTESYILAEIIVEDNKPTVNLNNQCVIAKNGIHTEYYQNIKDICKNVILDESESKVEDELSDEDEVEVIHNSKNILGIILVIGVMFCFGLKRKFDICTNYRKQIYYDLLKLEGYIKNDANYTKIVVHDNWESLIRNCSLSGENLVLLYELYIGISNYNLYFENKNEVHCEDFLKQYRKIKESIYIDENLIEYTENYLELKNILGKKNYI